MKIRGHWVELSEIEAALNMLPGVREAAVAAREGPGGTRLIAYLVAPTQTVSARLQCARPFPGTFRRGWSPRCSSSWTPFQGPRPARLTAMRFPYRTLLGRSSEAFSSHRAMRSRRRSPESFARSWASRGSEFTTTSSISAGTRCWPLNWRRKSRNSSAGK